MGPESESEKEVPQFFVIGAAKAGTSSFANMLEKHPRVRFTRPREPNFFSVHYEKGWSWYRRRFPAPAPDSLLGDKRPSYSYVQGFPEVPERIHRDLPHAKLIYVVRSPIGRIESRWMQFRASGSKQISDVRRNVYGIVDTTRYLVQVEAYRKFFSDNKIHVVFFEGLTSRPAVVMSSVFQFLGVSADEVDSTVIPHRNAWVGKREDGRLLGYLRHWLPEDTRKIVLPRFVRTVARDLLKRPIAGRPRWNADTRQWLQHQLRAESEEFLRRYRGDGPFWDSSWDAPLR
jgi:hypothetical protein